MSQVLHECPPVTLVVQQHMSAHSAAHTCSVTLQNLNFFLLALPSLICITHRINMVITTCLGFSHKGSPLTLHRLVCALQVTCVRYLLVCKRRICARGEGWTTQEKPPTRLSRMCSHTYQHMHTAHPSCDSSHTSHTPIISHTYCN